MPHAGVPCSLAIHFMKKKDTRTGKLSGKSSRMGWLLVLVAAVTLESTNLIHYFYSQKEIRKKASMEAESPRLWCSTVSPLRAGP